MTMTDTQTETPKAKPKKKRSPAKRQAATPKQEVPKEFAGLTPTECCDACTADYCVVSGINVCSHPFKGGLQAAQLSQPEAVKRFGRAKMALKDAMIDLRGR